MDGLKDHINVLVCGTGKTLMCNHWNSILYNSSSLTTPGSTCEPVDVSEVTTVKNAITYYLMTELCLMLAARFTPSSINTNNAGVLMMPLTTMKDRGAVASSGLSNPYVWCHDESRRFVKRLTIIFQNELQQRQQLKDNVGDKSAALLNAKNVANMKKMLFDESLLEHLLNRNIQLRNELECLFQREASSMLTYASSLSVNFGAIAAHYSDLLNCNDLSSIELANMMKKDAPYFNVVTGSFEGLKVNVREYFVTASQFMLRDQFFAASDVLMYCIPLCSYFNVQRGVNQLMLKFKEWEATMNNRHLNQLNRIVIVFNTTEMFKYYLHTKDLSQTFSNVPQDLLFEPNMDLPNWNPYEEKLNFALQRTQHCTENDQSLNFSALYIPDIMTLILSYLPWRDVVQYTTVDRMSYSVATSNAIWKSLCSRYIAGFDFTSEEDIASFLNEIYSDNSTYYTQNKESWSVKRYLKRDLYMNNLNDKNLYYKYFMTGGVRYCSNVEFIVNQFLKCVKNDRIKQRTFDNVIICDIVDRVNIRRHITSTMKSTTRTI